MVTVRPPNPTHNPHASKRTRLHSPRGIAKFLYYVIQTSRLKISIPWVVFTYTHTQSQLEITLEYTFEAVRTSRFAYRVIAVVLISHRHFIPTRTRPPPEIGSNLYSSYQQHGSSMYFRHPHTRVQLQKQKTARAQTKQETHYKVAFI